MTEQTKTVDPEVQSFVQAKMDEFLDMVSETVTDMGYCEEFEATIERVAQNNPDKLEYVEPKYVQIKNVWYGEDEWRDSYDRYIREHLEEFQQWCAEHGFPKMDSQGYNWDEQEYAAGGEWRRALNGFLISRAEDGENKDVRWSTSNDRFMVGRGSLIVKC